MFAGFDASSKGITPTAECMDMICNHLAPKNKTGVRSFQVVTDASCIGISYILRQHNLLGQ